MAAWTDEDIRLTDLIAHFDRAKYVEQIRSCANKRTSAETLQSIYECFFSPNASTSREDFQGFSQTDLSRMMQYKLSRGKWRPRLQQLIETNPNDVCLEDTRDAQNILERDERGVVMESIRKAIRVLIQLKAVGPATASLILSVMSPSVPFFSDEFAAFHPPHSAKIQYDLNEYLDIIERHREWLDQQSVGMERKVSSREVEEMVWFWYRTKVVDSKKRKTSRDAGSAQEAKKHKR